jgi:thymidylate kinase
MSDNMIIIEFFGIPGSGKSTIRRNLVNLLMEVDEQKYLSTEEVLYQISIINMDKIYRAILNILPKRIGMVTSDYLFNRSIMRFNAQNRFLAQYGGSFKAFLSSKSFDEFSILDRIDLISAYIQAGAIFESINQKLHGNQFVFFDEGFIQKSFMFVSLSTDVNISRPSLLDYLTNIPKPDIVINVKADIRKCIERMNLRTSGYTNRLRRINEQYDVFRYMELYENHVEDVIYWLRENSNTKILELDNNVMSMRNLDELKNIILHLNFDI